MPRTTHNDPDPLAALKHELSTDQSKYTNAFVGLVAPCGPALDHPAAPMLIEFWTAGCDATNDNWWSMELLKTAITKGAHPSALLLEPAAQLCAETLEKISQGYAQLVTWDDIKHDPPPKLKISLITTIPHKSRGYQMILDLSYGFMIRGTCHPSINESTKPDVALTHALKELGHILPHLIYSVTTTPDNQGPILFSKLDIKDGYW